MWPRLAFAAAAVTMLVGCNAGGAGTSARPLENAPAVAIVAQTGVSNGLAAVASPYTLVAVDGHALPYASQRAKGSDTPLTEVVSGTLNLERDGTFAVSTTYRAADAQGQRLFEGKFTGACAPDGDGFRLYSEGGGETALTMKGDTVSVNNNGVIFRYLRRR
jgi:hypothetical protein